MKRRLVSALALVLGMSTIGVAGSVTGTVRDASTSAPIGGAIVSTHILLPDSIGLYDTADAVGIYTITDIPPGNQIYVIMAYAPGYKGYYLRFDDLGEGSCEFDVLLESEVPPPPGGGGDSTGVSGYVMGRSGSGGSLVHLNGAAVELKSGGAQYLATTDGNGYYSMRVRTGNYGMSVSAQGYKSTASSGVAVVAGGLSYGAVLKGQATDVGGSKNAPASFALHEAYPNPFNPGTRISFFVATDSRVSLRVYDLLGREIATLADGVHSRGPYALQFDATKLSSGIYLVRMEAVATGGPERFVGTRRLMLLR